jgi:hypothetical protein
MPLTVQRTSVNIYFIVFYRPLFAYMLWLLYSLSCHLRFLIITFGFFKKLTYVVFYDDNLLIHVNFTHLNTILTVTEYILVTKYILSDSEQKTYTYQVKLSL